MQLSLQHVRAQDEGKAWFAVLACFIVHFLLFSFIKCQAIFIVCFFEEFAHSPESAAIIPLIPGSLIGVCALLGPFCNAVGSVYGYHKIIAFGSLLVCIGTLLAGFAENVISLLFSWGILIGVGYGCIYSPALVAVNLHFNLRRSLAVGVSISGSSLSQIVSPYFANFIIEEYTWRGACFIYAGLGLNILLAAAFFFCAYDSVPVCKDDDKQPLDKSEFDQTQSLTLDGDFPSRQVIRAEKAKLFRSHDALEQSYARQESEKTNIVFTSLVNLSRSEFAGEVAVVSEETQENSCLFDWKGITSFCTKFIQSFNCRLFGKCSFCLTIICFILTNGAYTGFFIFWLPVAKEFQISKLITDELFLPLAAVTEFSFRILSGYVSDKFSILPQYVVLTSAFLMGILFIFCSFVINDASFLFAGIGFGIFTAPVLTLLSPILVKVVGLERLSAAFGIYMLCCGMSSPLFALLIGLVSKFLGYRYAFIGIGSLCILSSFLLIILSRLLLVNSKNECQ